mmetsp:Transcript_3056/g.6867  ORF Transcript_3056/g.6867 Transcript_3056/m.6867 type:complete len:285 (-) Transcript_3056:79-933(-)
MPVDYSKFDRIEDSDEEPAKTSSIQPAARPKQAWAQESAGSSSGRQKLEPAGLESTLRMVNGPAPQDFERLAGEIDRLGLSPSPLGGMPPSSGAPVEQGKPGEPKKLCVSADGRKKVHTTFPDGAEMVEEFDEKTEVLLLRKTRRPKALGGEGDWVFEVGQGSEQAFDPYSDLLRASSNNPIFLRKDTPEHFQWRIRNIPYPADVYKITIDHETQQIVIRTSNKKYFKRIDVPDMRRLSLKLQDEMLVWKYQHGTLIISYTKPPAVVDEEHKTVQMAASSALKM